MKSIFENFKKNHQILIEFLFFQRLQEIDDDLLKVVRSSSGRNPASVEAEIRELNEKLAMNVYLSS